MKLSKERIEKITNLTLATIFASSVFIIAILIVIKTEKKPHKIYIENIEIIEPNFKFKEPNEGIWESLLFYDIKYPEIVYAQAILETGWFNSHVCKMHNNLFGLYDSNKQDYFEFSDWWDSVLAYKTNIQYRYERDAHLYIDYYDFLEKIHYAEDPEYINKVKSIVKTIKTKQYLNTLN